MLTAARANQSHNRTRTRQQVLATAGEPAKRSPRLAPPRPADECAPRPPLTHNAPLRPCGTAAGPSFASSRAQRGALAVVSSESANKRGSPPTPQPDMPVGRRTKDESPAMTPVDSPGGGLTRGKTVSAPNIGLTPFPSSLSLSLSLLPRHSFLVHAGPRRRLRGAHSDLRRLGRHDPVHARHDRGPRHRHRPRPPPLHPSRRAHAAPEAPGRGAPPPPPPPPTPTPPPPTRVLNLPPPSSSPGGRSARGRVRAGDRRAGHQRGARCAPPPSLPPSLSVPATCAFVPMDSTSGRTCQRLSLSRSCACAWACGRPQPRPTPF
jgi:hypothetical protein